MKNISKEDFILWNTNDKKPIEKYDIVYHYTSVVELINHGFKLLPGEEFKCVAELSMSWQRIISNAIEKVN